MVTDSVDGTTNEMHTKTMIFKFKALLSVPQNKSYLIKVTRIQLDGL
jgi:hypothetical protein